MPDVKFWDNPQALGPSAGLVQQHYLKARKTELERKNPELEKKVIAVIRTHPKLASVNTKGDRWKAVFHTINDAMKAAELTINFNADRWFTTENLYASYAQAYARSGRSENGSATLWGDAQNPAELRAGVDDRVTLPSGWINPPAAVGAPTPARRGAGNLRPGVQSGQRIAAQMGFGGQRAVIDGDVFSDKFGSARAKSEAVESTNPHFNPMAKQVFTALNYGGRPNGSCTGYGESYLVLGDRFKLNAIYFPADTFFIQHYETRSQVSYHYLATMLAFDNPTSGPFIADLIDSCYFHRSLTNTSDPLRLLEAHIFQDVTFTGNLKQLCIKSGCTPTVASNARKFAALHGAQFTWV